MSIEQELLEILPTVIYQLPSVAGLLYALVVISNHNKRMLALVEKLCQKCPDSPTSDAESKNDATSG